jgi:hypothetical protein
MSVIRGELKPELEALRRRLTPTTEDASKDSPLLGLNHELSALELESFISPRQAARILGVSEITIVRHYRHLYRRLSPRRWGLKLRDVLAINNAA